MESRGFPAGASGEEPTWQRRRCKRPRFDPRAEKIPWSRAQQPTPVFLPGESHGQRSLVGYSPWNTKRWTRLKQFCTHAHMHILIIQWFLMEMLWGTNKGCSSEGITSFGNKCVGWLLFAGLHNYLRCEFWRGIWNFLSLFSKYKKITLWLWIN